MLNNAGSLNCICVQSIKSSIYLKSIDKYYGQKTEMQQMNE